MKTLISRKILTFMIFFSVFLFGQFSNNEISITGVNVASACNSDGTCGSGETIFNCKVDCYPDAIDKPIEDILDDIIKWVLGFGLALSIIFLIWGGIYYIGSSGDAQKAETAKKIIKYAILGIIVMGMSFAIITAISIIFAP